MCRDYVVRSDVNLCSELKHKSVKYVVQSSTNVQPSRVETKSYRILDTTKQPLSIMPRCKVLGGLGSCSSAYVAYCVNSVLRYVFR